MLNKNTMFMFHGVVRLGNFKDTTILSIGSYVLDVRTWEWKQVERVYDDNILYPSSRAGLCLATYNTNCVILFGSAKKYNHNKKSHLIREEMDK